MRKRPLILASLLCAMNIMHAPESPQEGGSALEPRDLGTSNHLHVMSTKDMVAELSRRLLDNETAEDTARVLEPLIKQRASLLGKVIVGWKSHLWDKTIHNISMIPPFFFFMLAIDNFKSINDEFEKYNPDANSTNLQLHNATNYYEDLVEKSSYSSMILGVNILAFGVIFCIWLSNKNLPAWQLNPIVGIFGAFLKGLEMKYAQTAPASDLPILISYVVFSIIFCLPSFFPSLRT